MNKLVHDFQGLVKEGRVQVPTQVRDTIEAGVDQARTKWATVSGAIQDLNSTQLAAANSATTHVLSSVNSNVEAVADLMLSLTRVESVAEAYQIQTKFASAQWARQLRQTQEFFNIATRALAEVSTAIRPVQQP